MFGGIGKQEGCEQEDRVGSCQPCEGGSIQFEPPFSFIKYELRKLILLKKVARLFPHLDCCQTGRQNPNQVITTTTPRVRKPALWEGVNM